MKEKINIKIKKLFQISGMLIVISGIIFLLIHSFIVTGSQGENFTRDLFGFPIPHPPLWTSYIPYLGSLLAFIFEFFSIHGLVGVFISLILFGMGSTLIHFGENRTKVSDKKI